MHQIQIYKCDIDHTCYDYIVHDVVMTISEDNLLSPLKVLKYEWILVDIESIMVILLSKFLAQLERLPYLI